MSNEVSTTMSPEEIANLPNVGIRFLFDERQAQTSAHVLLQWCIDSQTSAYLRQKGIKDPALFICVTSPSGREERRIVPLSGMQELVQFHRAGVHTIYGRILWGDTLSKLRKTYTARMDRNSYVLGLDRIQDRYYAFGNAELKIDVPGEFFAKPLSAWEKWWLTLWLGELWDECSIRRRRAFAYLIQLPLESVLILWKTIFRFAVATTLGGVLLQRKVSWKPILHPFDYELSDIWRNNNDRLKWHRTIASRLIYDARGDDRDDWELLLWFLFPPLHVILLGISGTIVLIRHETWLDVLKWYGYGFAAIVGTIALIAAISVAIWGLVTLYKKIKKERAEVAKAGVSTVSQEPSKFALWLTSAGKAMYRLLNAPGEKLGAYNERRATEHVERLYTSLECETAPSHGIRSVASMPLSVKRLPRLLYQGAKAKICKPMARG